MRVAIIHYWLVALRGGEKVLESICELYPDAEIFTHVYDPEPFEKSVISKHKIHKTFISKLPFAKKYYQSYLPLMPLALEELNLTGFDLVISSESGPAKGVIPPIGVPHICYCHSPMRYAWDMYHIYKSKARVLKRLFMPFLMHYLRRWDQLNSTQVTHFIANSQFVASRIKSYYGRSAEVIYPPVSFEEFELSSEVEDYYLLLGQLVDYKKADIAIEAFNQSGKRLIVVGEGGQRGELEKSADSNIEFKGRLPFSEMKRLLSRCKALIFPGVEDFGIVPLEVMASGRPVIAYAKGGALETVLDRKTGVLFHAQTSASLNEAINEFERSGVELEPYQIRGHAESFREDRFKYEFNKFIESISIETRF